MRALSCLRRPLNLLRPKRREAVSFPAKVSAGTIVVKTGERRLYYVMGDGRALRYPVGVGKAGMQWAGRAQIDGKYIKPAWAILPTFRG